jgi:hypothetical protein
MYSVRTAAGTWTEHPDRGDRRAAGLWPHDPPEGLQPFAFGSPRCDDFRVWTCTAAKGHSGLHTAHCGELIIDFWPQFLCRSKQLGHTCDRSQGHSGSHGDGQEVWPNLADRPGVQPYEPVRKEQCRRHRCSVGQCTARRDHPGLHTHHNKDGVPLETAKQGGNPARPEKNRNRWCEEPSPAKFWWVCSVVKGHSGRHVAHDSVTGMPLAVWGSRGNNGSGSGWLYRPYHPRLCAARRGPLGDCTCSDVCFDGTLPPIWEEPEHAGDIAEMSRTPGERKELRWGKK